MSYQLEIFSNPDVFLPTLYKTKKNLLQHPKTKSEFFYIQNRRFLGNKFKLLDFIEEIIINNCDETNVLCDIFAGSGVVGERFNKKNTKVIANDILASNYISLKTFLGIKEIDFHSIKNKIDFLNELVPENDNYFSENFGDTYFTMENARKIGAVREKINDIGETEKPILITSLLYAVDKVSNTVGHYDAYRKVS